MEERDKKTIKGVAVFIVTLLLADLSWKFMIRGDDYHKEVMLIGLTDIQFMFNWAIDRTVRASAWILNLSGQKAMILNTDYVVFDNGNGAKIVWGCTAMKQSFIFMCIILTAKGDIKKKLGYIAAGWVFIFFLNIGRITTILAITHHHPELFELMHSTILKYLFYAIIFLMWVLWNEKLSGHQVVKAKTKE